MPSVTINGLTAAAATAGTGVEIAGYDSTLGAPKTRKWNVAEILAALTDPDFTTLQVASGATLTRIIKGTAAVTTSALAAGAAATVTASISGLATGDHVIVNPTAAPNDGLIFIAWVSAANTLSIKVFNAGASPDSSTTNFNVLAYRAT